MVGCLKLAERWHPGEADAVVDDPKQLLIGVALHSLTGEIRSAWVDPLPRWRSCPAIDAVAYAAIQTVMCTSCFSTSPCVSRWWWNTAAATQANGRLFEDVRYSGFKRSRILQRRQTQTHQSNSGQHYARRNNSLPRQATSQDSELFSLTIGASQRPNMGPQPHWKTQ